MGATYQQAALAVTHPEAFGAVRGAIANAFSPASAGEFLRSLERASLRVRDFEAVLGKDLLGSSTAAHYASLSPGDQGQIREFYLASLEQVAPELRNRFFKLYAYY